MGCHWKRLIKAAKNFEIFFRLGLTLPSGTPAKGPRDPRKPTFFKRSIRWRAGCRLKHLVKLIKNFDLVNNLINLRPEFMFVQYLDGNLRFLILFPV